MNYSEQEIEELIITLSAKQRGNRGEIAEKLFKERLHFRTLDKKRKIYQELIEGEKLVWCDDCETIICSQDVENYTNCQTKDGEIWFCDYCAPEEEDEE